MANVGDSAHTTLGGVWLPVVGYEGAYEVSSQGEVYSLKTQTLLKSRSLTDSGHLKVGLRTPGQKNPKYHSVHILVLEAFVGHRPEGMLGLHWDDDVSHNHLANLYWGTKKDNALDRVRNGRDYNANKTHCPQGHAYTPDNVYLSKGKRSCRKCQIDNCRQRRASLKEMAA